MPTYGQHRAGTTTGTTAVQEQQKKRKKRESKALADSMFERYAEYYGFKSPTQAGQAIAASITPEESYQWYVIKAQRQVEKYYNDTVAGRESLKDPQARSMMFQAMANDQKMEMWRKDWPEQFGPMTLTAGLSLPQLSSKAMSFVYDLAFQVYGHQYSAMALNTALIDDDEQRNATWELLAMLSKKPVPVTGPGISSGVPVDASTMDPNSEEFQRIQEDMGGNTDALALLDRVMENPQAFDEMSDVQKTVVINAARGVLDVQDRVEQDLQSHDIPNQMVAAQQVLMRTRGYNLALNNAEKKRLRNILKGLELKSGNTATRGQREGFANAGWDKFIDLPDQYQSLGITDFKQTGYGENVRRTFRIDPDWIKSNFTKAVAVMSFLQAQFPETKFEYTKGGALASVGGLIGQGTDGIGAFVGTGLYQLKEVGDMLKFPDREEAQKEYERLRGILESGKYDEGERDQIMADMFRAKDMADNGFGLSPGNLIETFNEHYYTPETGVAQGFADVMSETIGVYPGDPGYDTIHAVASFIGVMAFDPVILAGKAGKALKLAMTTPETAVISRSMLTQTMFQMMAKTPENLLFSRRGQALADRITTAVKTFDSPEAAVAHISKVLNVAPRDALRVVEEAARGPEALHAALLNWMMGEGAKPILEGKLTTGIKEVNDYLQLQGKTLPNTLKNLRAKLARASARIETPEVKMEEFVPEQAAATHEMQVAAEAERAAKDLTWSQDLPRLEAPPTAPTEWAPGQGHAVWGGVKLEPGEEVYIKLTGEKKYHRVTVEGEGYAKQMYGRGRGASDDAPGLKYTINRKGQSGTRSWVDYDHIEDIQPATAKGRGGQFRNAGGQPALAVPDGWSVNLKGQRLDRTGKAVGDITEDQIIWVRTKDLENVDIRLPRTESVEPGKSLDDYARQLNETKQFPKPVEITLDQATGRTEMVDGNHTYEAAVKGNVEYTPVWTTNPPPENIPLQQRAAMGNTPSPVSIRDYFPEKFRTPNDAEHITDVETLMNEKVLVRLQSGEEGIIRGVSTTQDGRKIIKVDVRKTGAKRAKYVYAKESDVLEYARPGTPKKIPEPKPYVRTTFDNQAIPSGVKKVAKDRNFGGLGSIEVRIPVRLLRDERMLDEGLGASIRYRTPVRAEHAVQRSEKQLERIAAYIDEHGDVPGKVMAEVRDGRLQVIDGTHRIMMADEKGLDYITVHLSTGGLQTAEKTYDWLEHFVPTALWKPAPELTAKIAQTEADIAQVLSDIEALKAGRADQVARKAYLESILKGTEHTPITPLRSLPANFTLRKIAHAKTLPGKIWDYATRYSYELPMTLYDNLTSDAFRAYLDAHPLADKMAGRLMQSLRRVGEDTGYSKRIWIDGAALPPGLLPDEATVQTYKNIRDFGMTLGAPDSVIDNMINEMAAAAAKGSRSEQYEAFTRGYERLIESGRRVNPTTKAALQDMWPEMAGERAPGYVALGEGVNSSYEPTLWTPIVNPRTGRWTQAGSPIIEADLLQGFTLPSYAAMQDHVSAVRSYLKGMKESGKFFRGKVLANTYFTMGAGWRSFNSLWSKTVLLGRIFGALPARIQLEQQIRIEAFGFSGMVKHPFEWFKSVRGAGEFALFKDSPAYALGIITKDMLDNASYKMVRRGRQLVDIGARDAVEREAAVRAVVGRLHAYNASPSMRHLLNEKLSDAEVLAKLMDDPFYWDNIGPIWEDIVAQHVKAGSTEIDSLEKVVARVRLEAQQLIGTGKKAKQIRNLAKTGRLNVDGSAVQFAKIGDPSLRTPALAKEAKQALDDVDAIVEKMMSWMDDGSWKPTAGLFPRVWGDYIPASQSRIAEIGKNASDWLFEHFYSTPDRILGRSPLYRQIAAKEYSRLRALGWSEKRAKDVAAAFGARQTADILFTIGANSSADLFLRSAMPFFPAWKELADTWLRKIPLEVGGGGFTGWLLGAGTVVRKADAYVDLFRDLGWIKQDTSGNWVIPAPMLRPVVRAFTGIDAPVNISGQSFTSLLPTPSLREDEAFYKGFLPTLGAPASNALHQINNVFGDRFKDLEDNMTMFGTLQSLGPKSLDDALNAMGVIAPWQIGSSGEMAKMRREWAVVDAMRVLWEERYDSMPKEEDFDSEKSWVQAKSDWLAELMQDAERSASGYYMLRGISSFLLPFSYSYKTHAAEETSAMWDVINSIEDDGQDFNVRNAFLGGFAEAHPELGLYLTGKTVTLKPEQTGRVDDYEQFLMDIGRGDKLALSPDEWLIWAAGQQEAALHRAKMDEIFRKFGASPQRWLLSGFQHTQALNEEQNRWDSYLRQSDMISDALDLRGSSGQPISFRTMYEDWRKMREARWGQGEESTTMEQDMAAEAVSLLQRLTSVNNASQYSDDNVKQVIMKLNDLVDKEYEKSQDPVFRATGWWWTQVAPYFEAKNEIWSKINELPKSARDPYYRQLTDIENEWATKSIVHPKWGRMPVPQEVIYSKMSPKDKRLWEVERATLPVQFNSRWQRQKVYGKNKKDNQIDELLSFIDQKDQEKSAIIDSRAINPSSKEGEAIRDYYDHMYLNKAKELGVLKEYAFYQAAPYERVNELYKGNPFWDALVDWVRSGAKALEAADISPRGSTTEAVQYQRSVVARVEAYRAESPAFDNLMTVLEIAYGEGQDKPAVGTDTYWPLFFDGWSTAPGYLQYYTPFQTKMQAAG